MASKSSKTSRCNCRSSPFWFTTQSCYRTMPLAVEAQPLTRAAARRIAMLGGTRTRHGGTTVVLRWYSGIGVGGAWRGHDRLSVGDYARLPDLLFHSRTGEVALS